MAAVMGPQSCSVVAVLPSSAAPLPNNAALLPLACRAYAELYVRLLGQRRSWEKLLALAKALKSRWGVLQQF